MALNFGLFFIAEDLRLDGSNFADWYLCLRDTLQTNDLLYVIDKPLRDQPDDSTSEEVREEWHDHYGMYVRVEWLMCTCMNFDLRGQFSDSRANEIITGLKVLFMSQVRVRGTNVCMSFFQP